MSQQEQREPTPPHSGDASPAGVDTEGETPATAPNELTAQRPPPSLVTSLDSFTEADEYYRPEPNGEMVFENTILVLLDPSDDTVYFGNVKVKKRNLSMEQARNSLERIPHDEIYPPLPADWSALAMTGSQPEYHLKRPHFASYEGAAKGTKKLAERFLEEARTLHLMRLKPHPNLLKLEGCLVQDGRIHGVFLKRYPITLDDRVAAEKRSKKPLEKAACVKALDRAACFKRIVAGVKHLHSLGIAHNDINPNNIMLDEEDRPVIVDLGGCRPFGEEMVEGGTLDWNDGFDEDVSTANNDMIGLRKVGEWLGISEELIDLACAV